MNQENTTERHQQNTEDSYSSEPGQIEQNTVEITEDHSDENSDSKTDPKNEHREEYCLICRVKAFCYYDNGVPFCDDCEFRRTQFLFGRELCCSVCNIKLNQNKYLKWNNRQYCKRCLSIQLQEIMKPDALS